MYHKYYHIDWKTLILNFNQRQRATGFTIDRQLTERTRYMKPDDGYIRVVRTSYDIQRNDVKSISIMSMSWIDSPSCNE